MVTDPADLSDTEIAEAARAAVAARADSGALGVTSTTVDGTTTQFDDEVALRVADKLAARAARSSGRRPFFQPISLRGPAS
jgi:hypothetical protein